MRPKILQITKTDIPPIFLVSDRSRKYELKVGRARPIEIDIPFFLDKDIAKICAMIMDGTIDKNLYSCSFSQKKDKEKVKEFSRIVEKKFKVSGKYRIGNNNTPSVTFSSKSLSSFLYHCLDLHKSDEEAKIPKWIWKSPLSIIKEYVRYAFAMEGSVADPDKGKREIRFHSCDRSYLFQLSKLLKEKFSIKSKICEYFVPSYGIKYYLSIWDKKSILNFSNIGFALLTHQERLEKLKRSYKNKAWEITLVKIMELKKRKFHIKDVNKLFPYLCKRAIHWRLTQLVEFGYVKLEKDGYSTTKEGGIKADSIRDKVKITRLRTNPMENEKLVMGYLRNGENCFSQISRDLKINVNTIRNTLKRLEKKGKVRLVKRDKFQQKIYSLVEVDSEGSPEAGFHQTSYGFEPSTSGL